MNYRYIAVEGNIGAGKTTLSTMLAKHYNAKLVQEEFSDNTFLPKFYAEPERYAFPLELSFLADRYQQLKNLLSMQDMFQQVVVSDYVFAKSKLFARTNLKDAEYDLFLKMFEIIDPHLPPPDVLIYLHANIPHLQTNIHKRGRPYEQSISDDYLERVQKTYQQYMKQNLSKSIIIDMSEADFVSNPKHFDELVSFLEKDYDFQTHYLALG